MKNTLIILFVCWLFGCLILLGGCLSCKATLPSMKDYNNVICYNMDKCLTLNTYMQSDKNDCTNLILKCFKYSDKEECKDDDACYKKLQVSF